MIFTFSRKEAKVTAWIARQILQIELFIGCLIIPLILMFKGVEGTIEHYETVFNNASYLFWASDEEALNFATQTAKRFGLDYEWRIEGD